MKDPREKDENAPEQDNGNVDPNVEESATDSNWAGNQRVDEEGNELDPEDIK